MTTFELDKLFDKTEEEIKSACADATDGVTLPNGKWAQLGHDVSAALEALKQEVEAKPKAVPSGSAPNAITFKGKRYVLAEDGTCVYVTCDGRRVWTEK